MYIHKYASTISFLRNGSFESLVQTSYSCSAFIYLCIISVNVKRKCANKRAAFLMFFFFSHEVFPFGENDTPNKIRLVYLFIHTKFNKKKKNLNNAAKMYFRFLFPHSIDVKNIRLYTHSLLITTFSAVFFLHI